MFGYTEITENIEYTELTERTDRTPMNFLEFFHFLSYEIGRNFFAARKGVSFLVCAFLPIFLSISSAFEKKKNEKKCKTNHLKNVFFHFATAFHKSEHPVKRREKKMRF